MSVTLLTLLIFLGALTSVESARKKSTQVRFLNITTNFNSELSQWFNLSRNSESQGRSFDLSWNLSVDIPNSIYFTIEMVTKNANTNTYKSIYLYDFEFCRVWDGFMSPIVRTWFSNLKRFGNFPFKCPISKGYYYLKKMHPNRGSVPSFVPNGLYFTKVLMYIKKEAFKENIFDSLIETEIWFG